MRDAVDNIITLIGSKKIDWLAKEMHERIWAEHAKNDAYYDYTSVGKALYGKSDGDAQLGEDEISSDWTCLAEGFDGGDLPSYFADANKALKDLDWQAKRSLEQSCKDTYHHLILSNTRLSNRPYFK